jgi:hypothetical protein
MPTLRSVARFVSMVGHPFVMIAIMTAVAAARHGSAGEVPRTVALVALIAIVPVAALTAWQVRRGRWNDVDASRPQDRPLLYTVGIAAALVFLAYAYLARRDSFMLRGAVVNLGTLVTCAFATRWVKVSLHLAAATLAACALILLGSTLGWILAAGLPVLAWSRWALGRHRPLELALGFGVGLLAGIALHFI